MQEEREQGDRARARQVRMIDVANSLGLSRATVSLVMRNSPLVSAATRSAVLAEAERLGYIYNQAAANLRTQRNDLVGLVMPDVMNPFVGEVSLGVQEVLGEVGFFVMIANTVDRVDLQRQILQSLVGHRAAGVVTIPALTATADDFSGIRRSGLPTVLLLRHIDGVDLPFVGTDEEAIGRLGAEHLISVHGCRRVAYFGGDPLASPRVGRMETFRQAVAEAEVEAGEGAGVEWDAVWSEPLEATADAAYRRASELLAAGPPPDGVLCHSDNVAYGLVKALRTHDAPPCAVLGIDDLHQSAMWNPPISSIATDPVELGRVCGRVLLDEMGMPVKGRRTPPAPEIHARASCGCH
ncbi:LacI family DNA-binding transcriptional regulator [Nonomuraea sp. K274]|uniref:LacI family DNA-binding transcriptional regulator n=1 Tax=Nonomuraea cypriaca TaxID=1187855 RepID=A0A931A0Z4_9ACTN|nr:LacI family DNA-binding transcriptional regulator [Nonomuraea cypriaca]MBF8184186.1 LacI family DNA-binding transcriptional regulator [Nonomuraea cypriaca]